MHPTSLPGPFGIGDLGPEAYAFADFLVAGGQTLWQVLPLGPTGYGNSPYSAFSAFAGNTLLISPQQLFAERQLQQTDLVNPPDFPDASVDFDRVQTFKDNLLQRAFENFKQTSDPLLSEALADFCRQNQYWLDDYALFRALKESRDGAAWNDWEPALRRRDASALLRVLESLHDKVEAQKFYQFLFFKQWFALKRSCNERGIKLIGDMPIFVAHDSADVWTAPEQFKLDDQGRPTVVAGVPPDYFSATGQFWGNPLYNWDRMRSDGFVWWIRRIRAMGELFDIVRIDHFRGFVACWEIPAGEKTAEHGRWVNAPGRELFTGLKKELGHLRIIAEDLGVITPDVEALRVDFGFPGMRVLQFGFSSDADNVHLPANYPRETVAYTATHDNDTTVGWFKEMAGTDSVRTVAEIKREKQFCLEYLDSDGKEINWDFIRAVLESDADTAMFPLQDVLGLGSEARMNRPNTNSGNWTWRFTAGALNNEVGSRLRTLSAHGGRQSRAVSLSTKSTK